MLLGDDADDEKGRQIGLFNGLCNKLKQQVKTEEEEEFVFREGEATARVSLVVH